MRSTRCSTRGIQSPDLDVLHAMQALSLRGVLRRIPRAALVTRLASDNRIQMLRSRWSPGWRGKVSSVRRGLQSRRHPTVSLRWRRPFCRMDAIPPLDPAPSAPVPHLMATLRFGESVELGVMGFRHSRHSRRSGPSRYPRWVQSFDSIRPTALSSTRRVLPPRYRSYMHWLCSEK